MTNATATTNNTNNTSNNNSSNNESSTTKQIDFLIVGAGPVGLLAANLIIQAGFSVRIFGKRMFTRIYYIVNN